MSGRKRAAEGGSYRVLRGLNFKRDGAEVRHEPGETIAAADAPKHGTGQCDAGCAMQGEHDWLLQDGVLEAIEG